MYRSYNCNPGGARVGDCTIRAISKILNQPWITTYINICLYGLIMFDMPSSNAVWGKYLMEKGYKRCVIPDSCPDCYTVSQFADDHTTGSYILATGSHVVACVDGNYYDSWDSGREVPVYYFTKEG